MVLNSKLSIYEEYFYRLISLESALQRSVLEPICIRSDFPSGGIYSLMFFYAEERGEEILENRIKIAPDDIRKVVESHRGISLGLTKLRELINEGRKRETAYHFIDLSEEIFNYNVFVEEHQSRIGDQFFLYYPTCMPGHYSVLGNKILELSFNPEQTFDGANRELKHLLGLNHVLPNKEDYHLPKNLFGPSEYGHNLELIQQQLRDVFNFIV